MTIKEAMLRKLKFLTLPLGLSMPFFGVGYSSAATPMASFGVTAVVASGCSVSTDMLRARNGTIVANPASAVSVNCIMATPYMIGVNTESAGPGTMTGNSFFPLRSLISSETLPRKADVGDATGLGTGEAQPLVIYAESVAAMSAGLNTISVAITY